ncbi:unnamed protein product [Adineta steineri]|uniref:Band 7 domain-containing protein n=1 Tax=Adineta steineri TaxID=433720 RepID=A0A818S656_9BILA|nr:unnamed protein product [Adineta steineri]CAF1256337.1 unnamed protein product [Adineta steineri]CAF3512755.1 unnamed protein product [Adineta steineri]CAF3661538.1 unnamed protein product [Adineta steineri]
MHDTSFIDGEHGGGGAMTTGYTYTAQYGVRRPSSRTDVFRTQFGSMTAEDYLTPMLPSSTQRIDGNVARRLSRYSFIIPPRLFVHRGTDERDDYHSSVRLNRQDVQQHSTTQRTRHISPSRHNLDQHTLLTTHIHSLGYDLKSKTEQSGYFFGILIVLSYILVIVTFPLSLCFCLKVVQEYERAVIFRLGRILADGARGPGLFFILPCIDTYSKVDLRTVTFDVPPQEILTRDSVTVAVDAVVYFRIFNAVISITNVEDAAKSTKLLAATTLRNVLGTKTLHEILAERDKIDTVIQTSLDEATDPWGVKVERVEVKDVRLPVALQKAMAAEAEASRDARAKIIAAEGEMKASRGLKEAADIINESPIAMQLRYLQTLTQIATERNSTIVFPIPVELLQAVSLYKR